MKYLVLEEVDSTNSYASVHAAGLDDMTFITAAVQTAGRGQRGNSWESEPGKNLTFTVFFKPKGVEPRRQFSISEAAALGVADFLEANGIAAKVKWPNDIYCGDRKICGILIEHTLTGSEILNSRIGVGINVNQTVFTSDAPNPVSMARLTGREYDLNCMAAGVGAAIECRLAETCTEEGRRRLHAGFRASLWRGEGEWPFRRVADGVRFTGRVAGVAEDGMLSVFDCGTGETGRYAFKEIEWL